MAGSARIDTPQTARLCKTIRERAGTVVRGAGYGDAVLATFVIDGRELAATVMDLLDDAVQVKDRTAALAR